MILLQDKLDYSGGPHTDFFLCTGNSYITKENKLVMGRGAALEMKNTHPEIDRIFAKHIPHLGIYGLVLNLGWRVGVFQVKKHFKETAELELINESAIQLGYVARSFSDTRFHMNFPGIGYGNLLSIEPEITSMLKEYLPNNVIIYK